MSRRVRADRQNVEKEVAEVVMSELENKKQKLDQKHLQSKSSIGLEEMKFVMRKIFVSEISKNATRMYYCTCAQRRGMKLNPGILSMASAILRIFFLNLFRSLSESRQINRYTCEMIYPPFFH